MGGHRFPPRPQATGPRRLSPVPETTVRTFNAHIRRRVPRRPLLGQRRLPWPSPWWDRLGTLSSPPLGGMLDDACSGFTLVADRAVAPPRFAPGLSAHARGHRYRGPRRLPGPDSHRQAIPNLSLGLCHDRLLSLMRPSSLGAPHQSMRELLVCRGAPADLRCPRLCLRLSRWPATWSWCVHICGRSTMTPWTSRAAWRTPKSSTRRRATSQEQHTPRASTSS